jgi:hypothetical protein
MWCLCGINIIGTKQKILANLDRDEVRPRELSSADRYNA